MDIAQILVPIATICLGLFFVCLGVMLLVNEKVKNWFAKWWFPMDETDKERRRRRRRRSKNFVRLIDGPLMIVVGLFILHTALRMLNILPPGW